MGQEIGEWTNAAGSKALTKKIYLGKASNYFAKSGIAEFLIEAYTLKVGDSVMVIGPTTGVIETTVVSLHVNEEGAKEMAQRGDHCSFETGKQVRSSDKLYKVINAVEEQKA